MRARQSKITVFPDQLPSGDLSQRNHDYFHVLQLFLSVPSRALCEKETEKLQLQQQLNRKKGR
jgi:hypothetical protein